MYKIPLAEIKEKILETGKLDEMALNERIKAKINELSGLISEEGAAHIIANELGIKLVEKSEGKLKIKEIYAGMRNVTTIGRVTRKFPIAEFQKGEGKGKVCSLVLGDETGTIRVVFWNDKVNNTEMIKDNDILLVKDGYVRENRGGKEIHLNDRSTTEVNPEGETVGEVRQTSSFDRKSIADLQGEEGAELMGTVVQVFDPRFFNRKNNPAETSYVMNLVLDDSTGTIRTVLWEEQTNSLLKMKSEEVLGYREDAASFEDIKTELLGEQVKIVGRVKKNDMFERLEFHANLIERANPETEIKKLEEAKVE